jgi:uncharacterized protein YecT (DUF1311 family)
MKFAMKSLSVLVAAGFLTGAMAAAPANAANECSANGDLIKCIEQDLKSLDKELSKIFKG